VVWGNASLGRLDFQGIDGVGDGAFANT